MAIKIKNTRCLVEILVINLLLTLFNDTYNNSSSPLMLSQDLNDKFQHVIIIIMVPQLIWQLPQSGQTTLTDLIRHSHVQHGSVS